MTEATELEKAAELLNGAMKGMVTSCKAQTEAALEAITSYEKELQTQVSTIPTTMGFHPYKDSLQVALSEATDIKRRLEASINRFDMNLRANTGDPTLPMP
jgi:hypothetical protein